MQGRHPLSIGTDVFAGDADPSQRVKFGTEAGDDFVIGWTDEYSAPSSGKHPARKSFNDLFATFTAMVADVNKFGSNLPWDINIPYNEGAVITGSDGATYRSTIDDNLGNDPESDVSGKWAVTYGVSIVSSLPASPSTATMYILDTLDSAKYAPTGVYMHDGSYWQCLLQHGAYAFSIANVPLVPVISGCVYDVTVVGDVTGFNITVSGRGDITFLISNTGFAFAEPTSGSKRTSDGLLSIGQGKVELVMTASPSGTIYSAVELVTL